MSERTLKTGWQGRYYEDFEVGDVYKHPYGRTVTGTDNVWFTNIPVDEESERLDKRLETLDRVCNQDEIEITVLNVHEKTDIAPDEAGKDVVRSINENIDSLQGIPKTIERAKRTLEKNDETIKILTKSSNQKDVVLSVADDVAADIILVAGSKRSPVGRAVFGSVTQGIILEGDRPVLVTN